MAKVVNHTPPQSQAAKEFAKLARAGIDPGRAKRDAKRRPLSPNVVGPGQVAVFGGQG